MIRKTIASAIILVAGVCCVLSSQAFAQSHNVTDPACRALQLQVQAAVGDENPATYRNHGAYVSAVSAIVDPELQAGNIDAECASCITSQFARGVPVAEQVPCGPDGDVFNLRGPEEIACDGPLVGTVTFAQNGSNLDFSAAFTSGPANATLTVYWVCTQAPNGCHESACGFQSLGQISTDGSGAGVLNTTLVGGNPYPGMYVHIDIIDNATNQLYSHLGGDQIYPNAGNTRTGAGMPGDPTGR